MFSYPVFLRFWLVLIFIATQVNSGYGQDTLYFKNGEKLAVRVLSVQGKRYYYYLPGDKENYIRSIHSRYLIGLTLSGTIIPIPETPSMSKNEDKRTKDFLPHGIHYQVTDRIAGLHTIAYEYTPKSGFLTYRLACSFGQKSENRDKIFFEGENYYNSGKTFSIATEVHFFLHRQGYFRYFHGPGMDYGEYTTNLYRFDPNNNYSTIYFSKPASFASIYYVLGFQWNPIQMGYLTGSLGFGYAASKGYFQISNDLYGEFMQAGATGRINLGIGIKF